MLVLNGKAMEAYRNFKPINIEIDTRGWYDDPLVRSFRNKDEEKAFFISSVISHRPVDCIEQISW